MKNRTYRSLLALGLVSTLSSVGLQGTALAQGVSGSSHLPSVALPPGQSPKIETSLPDHAVVTVGEFVQFDVIVTDPQGDDVSVQLQNPPPNLIFQPAARVPSPSVHRVSWIVPPMAGGLQRLVFTARDHSHARARTRETILIRVQGLTESTGVLSGDVTGDGIADVIAGSAQADGSVTDQGAVFVWDGGSSLSSTPIAVLRVSGTALLGQIVNTGNGGYPLNQGIQLADVSGDGILDIIVANPNYAATIPVDGTSRIGVGAVFVWKGGDSLQGAPAFDAKLLSTSVLGGSQLGRVNNSGQGVQIAEVTGDGVLDVIAAAPWELGDPLVTSAVVGAVYVWKGGDELIGVPDPWAKVTGSAHPTGIPGLGNASSGQSFQIADVTGDGQQDLIIGDVNASTPDPADPQAPLLGFTGAVFVMDGGTRQVSMLVAPDRKVSDRLGESTGGAYGIRIGDVTGDGICDVIAAAAVADANGITNSGAVYVWAGGPGLIQAPQAMELTVPGASPEDRLGTITDGIFAIQLEDVTGDGVRDVIVGASGADAAAVDSGAIYVWKGETSIASAPLASLIVASASPGDQLGYSSGLPYRCEDVSGDGIRDVLAVAPLADANGSADSGALYIWIGGAALTGTCDQPVELSVSGTPPSSRMGLDLYGFRFGHAFQIADLTGDSLPDVVITATNASPNGAIYLWKGDTLQSATGQIDPDVTLEVSDSSGAAAPSALLGALNENVSQGVLVADLIGDATLDLVVGASNWDFRGAVFVWEGGASLSSSSLPRALTVPGGGAADHLGDADGQGLLLVDVTADGRLDVVAGTWKATVGGVSGAGAVFVWQGRESLGSTGPDATLSIPGVFEPDNLGWLGSGQGIQFADVTGDGQPDVVVGASRRGALDTGSVFVWKGGAGILTSPVPWELTDPSADHLGL